jgi:hypothetical protein
MLRCFANPFTRILPGRGAFGLLLQRHCNGRAGLFENFFFRSFIVGAVKAPVLRNNAWAVIVNVHEVHRAKLGRAAVCRGALFVSHQPGHLREGPNRRRSIRNITSSGERFEVSRHFPR